jgi:hypothetical protein
MAWYYLAAVRWWVLGSVEHPRAIIARRANGFRAQVGAVSKDFDNCDEAQAWAEKRVK